MQRIKKFPRYFWHHKKLSAILIVIIIILMVIFAPKTNAQIETQKVTQATITQTITASGKIESVTSVNLNFLTAGKLVYIGAQKGEFVQKGQTIASLDARTVQKNLEADLRDYQIQRNTFDQTKQDNQNRTPEQSVNEDMKRILQNNQYDLEKSVISVELQSLAKEQSYLITPISGVLTRADAVIPGVNVSTTNIYTIADPQNVYFAIEVDEADIGKVRPGMPVKLLLESYPDDPVNVTITSIDFASHIAANGGNVFNVEAAIPDNPDYKYRIGMTGDAEIIIAQQSKTITVPIGSVLDEKYVYVKKETKFEKRKVVTGIQSDTDIEIISGLPVGEEIALLPESVEEIQKNKKQFGLF